MKTIPYDSFLRKSLLTLIGAILCVTASVLQGTPTVSFLQGAVSVSQKAGAVSIPVQTTGSFYTQYDQTYSPRVTYSTQGGTATSGIDYGGTSGEYFYFYQENSTVNISIPIYYTGSTTNRFFTVVLSNPASADLGSITSVTITILAEPVVPPVVFSFTDSDLAVSQGAGSIQVPVKYTGTAKASKVLLVYRTQAGTANGYDDYEGTDYSEVEFAAGSNTALITIPIYNKGATVDKFFNVLLTDSSEGQIGTPAAAKVTILRVVPKPTISILTTKGPLKRWFNIHGAVSNVLLSDIKKVTLTINGQNMHTKGKKNWVARIKAGSSGTYTMVARAYLKNGKTLKKRAYLYIY